MYDDVSPEALEWGRWLFAQDCTFLRGVASLADLPDFSQQEVAFIGRSNVGKSSLLNALTGRTTLARTSHTPGRTQQLNFFSLGLRLILVDMPGYGYAKASKTTVAAWTELIRLYLKGRPTLARVYVLIDGRHGIKENDLDMMKMLDEAAVSYCIIVTKVDKVKEADQPELQRAIEETLKNHPAAFPSVHMVSSVSKQGIEKLRAHIAQCSIGSPQ